MILRELTKYKIGATVFICGAIFMALEIMAGRLLAPAYGDTVYVWGSMIGIFLISLSFGYYIGGKLADRRPDANTLSMILLASGILTIAIPFFYKGVISSFSFLSRELAPLASSVVIFIIPSVLLGMVSPFAIKLTAENLNKIGKLSGNLYAIATFGSVVGTFLATFILILVLSISNIFIYLGVTTLLVSLMLSKKKLPTLTVLAVCILAVTVLSIQTEPEIVSPGQIMEGPVDITFETLYGQITVSDKGAFRSLYINDGMMASMDLRNESKTVIGWEYIDCMETPFVFNKYIDDALILGFGAGNYPKKIYRNHHVEIDNVDINEKMFEIAHDYFNITYTSTFRNYTDDARVYLQNTDKKYDLVAIDVFHYEPEKGYIIPQHLTTQEFFMEVKDHLNSGGLLVMNFDVGGKNSEFLSSEYRTISSVFKSAYVLDCGTKVIIASKDKTYKISELIDRTNSLSMLLTKYYEFEPLNDSIIMTDDYAPITSFG